MKHGMLNSDLEDIVKDDLEAPKDIGLAGADIADGDGVAEVSNHTQGNDTGSAEPFMTIQLKEVASMCEDNTWNRMQTQMLSHSSESTFTLAHLHRPPQMIQRRTKASGRKDAHVSAVGSRC